MVVLVFYGEYLAIHQHLEDVARLLDTQHDLLGIGEGQGHFPVGDAGRTLHRGRHILLHDIRAGAREEADSLLGRLILGRQVFKAEKQVLHGLVSFLFQIGSSVFEPPFATPPCLWSLPTFLPLCAREPPSTAKPPFTVDALPPAPSTVRPPFTVRLP